LQEFLRGKIVLFYYTVVMNNDSNNNSTIIGFREWVGLPFLGLAAIKAKIDTGAKTSSLHAFDIFLEDGPNKKTYVLFKVHPLQNELGLVVSCRALLVDRRVVTDSGGHREERYVIRTTMTLSGIKKRVELTLTNRETMKYRMLIGRSALKQFYIDPSQSYLAGKTLKQKRFLKELKQQLSGKTGQKLRQS
jgi:hypothetical protein